jgi:hypothetical protein
VTHITEYSYRRSGTQLRWPFDIVQLSFEAASAPGLIKGGSARILWPEDDPRSAKIVGARPGAPWANWFYGLGEILAIGAVVIALFVVIGWRRRRNKVKAKTSAL